MPYARKIALIIGVDTYHHKGFDGKPSLPPLPSSKNDAMDLSKLISSEKFGFKIYGNDAMIGSNLDTRYGFYEIQRAIKYFFNNADIALIILLFRPWSEKARR